MMTEQSSEATQIVENLIELNQTSERNFFAAAEQMDNRAVKLLLKAYAQQHATFARHLEQTLPNTGNPIGASASTAKQQQATDDDVNAISFLQRGWLNLKAALIVRRQRRQRIVINDLLSNEDPLLTAYAQSVNQWRDEGLAALVEEQYAQIRTEHEQLRLLVEQDAPRLVLRLFDQAQPANQVVERLQAITSAEEKIVTVPIDEVPVYYNEVTAQPRNIRETVVTGGLLGAVAGGILGAIYGIFHALTVPEISGLFTTTPAGIIGEVALYGAFIGSFFSVIFSALISRSATEIDTYLYNDSLKQGNTLVAVFTNAQRVGQIEQAIGLRHEHEVEPIPA